MSDDCVIGEIPGKSVQEISGWSVLVTAELLFTFDLRKTMRSHAVVISNKSYRTTRKLYREPQDIAMNCIASSHPKFHQNIESDILKEPLEFFTSSTNLMSKNFLLPNED